MRVIFTTEVQHVGRAGDIKEVRDGYARNFLFPRGLAKPATARNTDTLAQHLAAREAGESKERARYRALAGELAAITLECALKTGGKGQVFGSITAQDIAARLGQRGIIIDRRWIELEHGIKAVGEHTVKIRLPHQITAEVKVIAEAKKLAQQVKQVK